MLVDAIFKSDPADQSCKVHDVENSFVRDCEDDEGG